ncbi:hypothetical protein Tco_1208306 [Tanacetum coccineum]
MWDGGFVKKIVWTAKAQKKVWTAKAQKKVWSAKENGELQSHGMVHSQIHINPLLRTKAEEEYGYQRNGGLFIPVASFFKKGDEGFGDE